MDHFDHMPTHPSIFRITHEYAILALSQLADIGLLVKPKGRQMGIFVDRS